MDRISRAQRSKLMARVGSQDTQPEMAVRRLIFRLGYRYRVNVKGLPGTPDIVFARRRKVIFVHGCFWHSHAGCGKARLPASNLDYWLPKLERTRERDAAVQRQLRQLGWRTLVVWECETAKAAALGRRICRFLG
jgi:DNA mismatch endonuclease (patch repair protein)